ncbi:MAG: aspartate aminotransferase family protein [Rhodobacteraceae bacterium]|nr:aspartate aminotransferase family protein [Paracoccaceae bacterium]
MKHIANHPATADMQALDAAHHLHPFTDTAALNKVGARIITSAKGVMLRDSEGNDILDAMAGLWCVNIGYGRDEMADVAARQMRELPYYNTFFQTSHPMVIALAEKIAALTPGDLNRTFFSSGGSDANDTNIRLVRHYWASLGKPEKTHIIARQNGYHGSTLGAASLGGMAAMHAQGGLPIPDISHIAQPYWYAEGGDLSPEEFGLKAAQTLATEIERLGEENVAAFIAEPVQGAGGVIVPPETYWPEIQRICDAHEILLIVDEVITGFGRTGAWFGSETYGIKPDIMTIAKGLSSGYQPIGGSVVSERVAAVFAEKGGEFNHGYTYSGHPVAAAVALENLRILDEENIVKTVATETAPYLAQRWAELGQHPLVGEARISGLMAAIELTPDASARAPFLEPGSVGPICRDHCFGHNLVMRHVGDKMIISPPLVISKAEIDTLVDTAHKALDLTLADATKHGLMKAGSR